MFGILNSLVKATVGVVLTPVAVVADVVTFGEGSKSGTHTGDMVENVVENLENAVDPNKN